MNVRTRIENALAVLGTTQNEIAERLLAEGCFGSRQMCNSCPVYRYLAKTLGYGKPNQLSIRSGQVSWYDHIAMRYEHFTLPSAVYSFIIWFDYGDHAILWCGTSGQGS